jgi:hypothetical protein
VQCPAEHPNNQKKGDLNKCNKDYNTMDLAWDAFSVRPRPLAMSYKARGLGLTTTHPPHCCHGRRLRSLTLVAVCRPSSLPTVWLALRKFLPQFNSNDGWRAAAAVNVEFNRVDCDTVLLGPYEAHPWLMKEGRLGEALEKAAQVEKARGDGNTPLAVHAQSTHPQSTDVEARYKHGRKLMRVGASRAVGSMNPNPHPISCIVCS